MINGELCGVSLLGTTLYAVCVDSDVHTVKKDINTVRKTFLLLLLPSFALTHLPTPPFLYTMPTANPERPNSGPVVLELTVSGSPADTQKGMC